LVTGGAGFIGSHLVDRLVNEGYAVRVVDDLSTGRLDNLRRHLNGDMVDFVEGEVFNIGSGKATSVNLLAKEVLSLAGVDLEIQPAKPRAGDIKDSYADISKAKRLLGFEPKVSLREGLKAIV